MEDFNAVDAAQEQVVDVQPETDTSEVITEEPVKEEPVAKVQSVEDNAKYAAARREAEKEKAQIQAKTDRLMSALNQYGYQGDPDEIADALLAQTQGISIEEATKQRQAKEAEDAKYQELQSQIEIYRPLAVQKLMADDLARIQIVYPEVKNLDELGEDFFTLMNELHDPILAYDAAQAKKARETKPIPQNIGAVNSSSSKEKDFYTSQEVDRLTPKELANPKIMERIMESMTKWK